MSPKSKIGVFNQPLKRDGKSNSFKSHMPVVKGYQPSALGTSYGTGTRNPAGKLAGGSFARQTKPSKQIGTPPKSLA